MRIKVLASGSTGNCCYIETKDHKILIDVGISKKAIDLGLSSMGVDFNEIDTLLITHEHEDHIHSLGTVLRKGHITCYMTRGTYQAIERGKNPTLAAIVAQRVKDHSLILLNRLENSILYPDIFLDETLIHVLPIFHDAIEPIGFKIESDGKSVVYLTDTGYVHQALYPTIADADCYVLEFNHDPYILMSSDRTYALKQRILSIKGHLSNQDCALTIANVMGPNTKEICLLHRSLETNTEELMLQTFYSVMKHKEIDVQHILIKIAKQDCFIKGGVEYESQI